MRKTIKFRAQDYIGEWHYGFIVQETIIPVNPDGSIERSIEIFVKPDTIGQYSGLHDKNGKEIYEGDIVTMMRKPEKQQRRELVRHVVTCHNVCDWVFESLAKEVLGLMMANHSDFDSYRFEVIGNIFDNPELAQPYSLNLPERKPRQRRRSNNVEIEIVMGDVKASTTVSQEIAQELVKKISK